MPRLFSGTVTRPASRFPESYGGGTVSVFTDDEFELMTGSKPNIGGAEVHFPVCFSNGDYNAQGHVVIGAVYLSGMGLCAVFDAPLKRNSDVRINYLIAV